MKWKRDHKRQWRLSDYNYFRLMNDEIVFMMPELKRPTCKEIESNFGAFKSFEDNSTEEAVMFWLATVLESNKSSIDGGTYEYRIRKLQMNGSLLGFQHRRWFLENWDNAKAIPNAFVRAALKVLSGKVSIDFPGLIVMANYGERNIPSVYGGKRWHGSWSWIYGGFYRNERIAVSNK